MILRSIKVAACNVVIFTVAGLSAFGCSASEEEMSADTQSDSLAAGPTAAQLLEKVKTCNQVSNGKYRTDDETAATVAVCDKNGAVFWKADLDIDCDGQRTSKCNENTDPWFQPDTAFHQSNGQPLNAETLPYVVVPSPSGTWNYKNFGIQGGGVVALIYNNKVIYAPVGDTGPTNIIGEASYGAAVALGIDPNPATGGTDGPVTYIVFKNSKVSPIESKSKVAELGAQLAQQFINNN
ncbi:glycoside hydrolase family 75 protein [Pendulispora rubella]|uniref:Glycoside hydrolase family 75 protein n=1 Tax=Pendulispora rubella TaxID=2741070 RepID=A0ABZ2LI20_9BACT